MVIVSRLGARITNFSALLLKESIIGVKRRSSVVRHPPPSMFAMIQNSGVFCLLSTICIIAAVYVKTA